MRRIAYSLLIIFALQGGLVFARDDQADRENMLREIRQMVKQTSPYLGKSALSEEVMAALSSVPRHEFVPRLLRSAAYLNRPLTIGNQQTISQPYIVALMTDLADVDENSVVLEVGTGSGYQAAVLAQLVRHVYSIEIIPALAEKAEQVLKNLGYGEYHCKDRRWLSRLGGVCAI